MPRAIEIYVDEKQKAVLINTNYGNREVKGASWEPITFRLGWDDASSISHAMKATVPNIDCDRIVLVDASGYPLTASWFCVPQMREVIGRGKW